MKKIFNTKITKQIVQDFFNEEGEIREQVDLRVSIAAIPELLGVIQTLRTFLSKERNPEILYSEGWNELVKALETLDEKHGTEKE